jgi:hypothetical protein
VDDVAQGLLCIVAGVALMVLPGPLTVPPVLRGLWIWSTEFRFAERFFDASKDKAREAWDHAKIHPTTSACITGGGLLAAGAAMWAVRHFRLVDMAKEAVLEKPAGRDARAGDAHHRQIVTARSAAPRQPVQRVAALR